MKKINKNFNNLKENYLFAEVGKRVDAYKSEYPGSDIISLGIGDVTQPLSLKVVDAGKNAANEMSMHAGFRGYAPYDGYPFLKNAIIDYYKLRGVNIGLDEVFVTEGAKEGIGNILDLFGKCNVMIPDPVYPAYVDANIMQGNKITYVNATAADGFLALPPKRGKADIIYLCSPNNPTGAAYDEDQLKQWVDFALEKNALILYDAAYESFVDDKATQKPAEKSAEKQADAAEPDKPVKKGKIVHSIFEISGAKDCAIEICSFSKMAGFTGVRCGWTVIPMGSQFNRMWMRRQATKSNGTSYIVQRMAESALREGFEDIKKTVAGYKTNAKLIIAEFDKLGIEYTGGVHAPYIWFNTGIDSWEFFDYLLKNARIVGTPGSGFGKNCNGWMRFTAFNTAERTLEAMRRFEPFWKEFTDVRDKVFTRVN